MSFSRVRLAALSAVTCWPALAFAQAVPNPLPLKLAPRPTTSAITPADLMTRVYIFADDSLMGREVGTEYHLKATAYIEREVRRLGLQPAGDNGTFFQNIQVNSHPLAKDNTLSANGKTFNAWTDYVPRDNRVFGPVKSIDGTEIVYGGVIGDASTMISQAAAAGKFVVISLPTGPDGKPRWGNFRQQLTAYYVRSAGVAVVGLEVMDDATRAALRDPVVTLDSDDEPQIPVFMYVTNQMAE